MVVTESGMVMLANVLQYSKALYPMVVTESGMVMLANELHPQKASLPIVVTESGMVMLDNELHLSKAYSPMVVTVSGMVTVFTAVLSTPHSFHEFSPSVSPGAQDTIVVAPFGTLKCPSAPTDGALQHPRRDHHDCVSVSL